MATQIKEALGIEVELVEGHDGVFDVSVGDRVVFSRKQKGGRFPEVEEVLESIEKP